METAVFESIVEENYSRVLRTAAALTGNGWEAEDLAQETFLAAIRARHRFAGRSQTTTWLLAILINLHRKRLRTARRRTRRWLNWLEISPRAAPEPPDRDLEWREWQDSLWSAVATLPEPQRYAVVLRFVEGMAYEQIAEVLDCPIGTVKSRLHHGLAALQKILVGRNNPSEDPPTPQPSVSRATG